MRSSDSNNDISSDELVQEELGEGLSHTQTENETSPLASYRPTQQLALTRYGRLKMLQRDVLPKLDPSDVRVKLTLKALYSTYRDLEELGLGEEARQLRDRDAP